MGVSGKYKPMSLHAQIYVCTIVLRKYVQSTVYDLIYFFKSRWMDGLTNQPDLGYDVSASISPCSPSWGAWGISDGVCVCVG